jgi:hypothetical protein
MIYLIDEKLERQISYGWPNKRFEEFGSILKRINTYQQLKEISSKEILKENNILLLHDSFFRNLNVSASNTEKFKSLMKQPDKNIKYVFFGGSFSSIYVDDNSLEIKDDVFYNNLNIFLNSENKKLKILAFGDNYLFEEFCSLKHEIWTYLFSLNDNDTLSEINKFEIKDLTNYNPKIIEVLEASITTLNLKQNLNQWKI